MYHARVTLADRVSSRVGAGCFLGSVFVLSVLTRFVPFRNPRPRALPQLISASVPTPRLPLPQHSTSTGNNCDTAATNNAGCGVTAPTSNSYGPAFNAAGGGWYAMERTNSFIKVWFWSRNSGSVPSDVQNGATSVNTDNWVRASMRFFVCMT